MNLVMQKYRILGKKGEGTFSEVLKCQHIKDGNYFAIKKMKQHYDSIEQVNNLREIQAMRRLSPHTNILQLKEVVFDKKSGVLALICELMDMNIYELIRGKKSYLPEWKIKNYMFQLVKSIEHMHRNGIFHRDVKPENILIKEDVLKLADFGSCRSVYSKQPYTEYISTRWYRAPECLLTDGFYSYKMDLWSVGCVFYEILSLQPLFPGSNEVDQIAKIHDVLGTPDPSVLNKLRNKTRGINFKFPPTSAKGIEKPIPHAPEDAVNLIYQMLAYDPDVRMTAKQAIRHPYFKEMRDAEKRQAGLAKGPKASVGESQQSEESRDKEEATEATSGGNSERLATGSTVISHNNISITHKEKRRKKRHHRRLLKDENANHASTTLPKVPQASTASTALNPTFPATAYSNTAFPKITTTTTALPSLTNSFKTKTKVTGQATRNSFGHYQLPSIDRRDAGY